MSNPQRRGLGRGLGSVDPDQPAPPGRATGRPRDQAVGTASTRRPSRPRPRAQAEPTAGRRSLRGPGPTRRWCARSRGRARAGRWAHGSPSCRSARSSPNPRQPRTVFDEEAMAELVHSITRDRAAAAGRGAADRGGRYELIMGERRWRATQEAGLDTIPAIVRDTSDDDLLRDALLENLHRSQLNPLEEAAAYQQLLDDFGCTHEELAARIGRSRPQISNTLRLLRLSPEVQRRVAAGVLSAGHARTLLAVPDAGGPGPARLPGGRRGHLGAGSRGDRGRRRRRQGAAAPTRPPLHGRPRPSADLADAALATSTTPGSRSTWGAARARSPSSSPHWPTSSASSR